MSFPSRRLGWGCCLVGALLWGCGDDGDEAGPRESNGSTDDSNNGGDSSDDGGVGSSNPPGTNPPGNNPPGSNPPGGNGSTPPGSGAAPPSFEAPDPVLPDVDGDTPVSDLDDDEAEQVCEAYLETAERLLDRVEGACGFVGLSVLDELESPTDQEFQAACHEAREGCRLDAEAGKQALAGAQCGEASECEATVDEFNQCYAQIHLLDSVVLGPLSAAEVPPCDEMTVQEATVKQGEVVLGLLPALLNEDLASLFEGESACQAIDEQCPGYSVPVEEFGLPQ